MSPFGTFRTWSDVRLESVVRTEADSADYYRFMGSRPREQPGSRADSPVVDPTSALPALEAGIDSPSQGPLRMAGTDLQSRRKVLVISA